MYPLKPNVVRAGTAVGRRAAEFISAVQTAGINRIDSAARRNDPLLAQPSVVTYQPIHNPTAAHVRTRLTAMLQQVAIPATGRFERIRQQRQTGESTVVVDLLSTVNHDTILPAQPRGLDSHGSERI